MCNIVVIFNISFQARLLNGEGLSPELVSPCIIAGIIGGLLALAHDLLPKCKQQYIPSGIAMAVGMYVAPNFTIVSVYIYMNM